MYDQNDQAGQTPAPQNNPNPYGQLPSNDSAMGIANDPGLNPSPATPAPSDDPFATTLPTPTDPQNDDHTSSNDNSTVSGDLLEIKQAALKQLNPLVEHLDQGPEERFKTTMMMIQASDDQSLIQKAYDAAQEIPDEKARAQALLDVVNEINYFTQQNSN